MRLDQFLTKYHPEFTRNRWKMIIESGGISINNKVKIQSSLEVDETDQIDIVIPHTLRYVSRSAAKLASFLDTMKITPSGVCLDIGSSTGGFTQVLLERGVEKVIAVDVGTDQLHQDLRNNLRIELHEQTDIRDFSPQVPIDFFTVDVSFISLELILPSIYQLCQEKTCGIFLFKPQFQVPARFRNKQGVVADQRIIASARKDFELLLKTYFNINASAPSALIGESGNQEYLYSVKVKKL